MSIKKLLIMLCCGVSALPAQGIAKQPQRSHRLHRARNRKKPRKQTTAPKQQHHRPQPIVRTYPTITDTYTAEDLAIPLTRFYTVYQGKTLHIKIRSPKHLTKFYTMLGGVTYTLSPIPNHDGYFECFIPFDCEFTPGEYRLIIRGSNEQGETKNLGCQVIVSHFEFKKQRGFKVSSKKMRSIKRAGIGGSRESRLLAKYITNSPKQKLWEGPFNIPVNLQYVTSPFGEMRTSHGMGHRHHRGIDMADSPRAPIRAANHGIVAVKTTTPVNGNIIAIDHGLGVFTLYCHMDSFNKKIAIGSKITKDQEIGKIGMTGYASGYHLHLEMRVNNIAVDFMEWTKNIY